MLHSLRLALDLMREYFPEIDEIDAELVHDPDTGEQWVALNVETPLSIAELLARDASFIGRWVAEAPWPERDKIAIMVYPA